MSAEIPPDLRWVGWARLGTGFVGAHRWDRIEFHFFPGPPEVAHLEINAGKWADAREAADEVRSIFLAGNTYFEHRSVWWRRMTADEMEYFDHDDKVREIY